MGDGGAERIVRNVLHNAVFTYDKETYKVIQNEKPQPETKTDFYVVAENVKNIHHKIFKISYKKPSYTFMENKIKPDRLKAIFGKDCISIIQDQIMQKNRIKENKFWKKKNPDTHLSDSFKNFPLVQQRTHKIMLGWRYEIEQRDMAGTRTLTAKIEQDIARHVFWCEDCIGTRRDGLINGVRASDSGIPDYILVRDPEDIKTAQDVFSNICDIREYAKQHSEMRATFMSQYYRWHMRKKKLVTEGKSRTFAVWVKWQIINGKIDGKVILDKPLQKTSGQVLDNLETCMKMVNIDPNSKTCIDELVGNLTPSTLIG